MKIIPNHFNKKPTHILGDYILNGCECFHITKLDKICKLYHVSDDLKQQVLEAWEKNKINEDEKHLDVLLKLTTKCLKDPETSPSMKDAIEKTRIILSNYGRPEHLDVLVNDKYSAVRYEVFKHKRDKDLDILVRDPDCFIRAHVASHGRPQDLDILVHDEYPSIRILVAKHGRPEDLDILVHDPEMYVRAEVVNSGRDQDLDILVNDSEEYVRGLIAKRGRDRDLDILVHDESYRVREAVADFGRDKDLDILINDNDWDVRYIVVVKGRPQDLAKLETITQGGVKRFSSSLRTQPNQISPFLTDWHLSKLAKLVSLTSIKCSLSEVEDVARTVKDLGEVCGLIIRGPLDEKKTIML